MNGGDGMTYERPNSHTSSDRGDGAGPGEASDATSSGESTEDERDGVDRGL